MSLEQELFYDSYLEALRDDVNACSGPKEVGHWFWPEKSPETRRNSVNDRQNTEKRDRFSDDQVQLIMRRTRERRGFSAAVTFICDHTGFERPKSKDPENERAPAARVHCISRSPGANARGNAAPHPRAARAGGQAGRIAMAGAEREEPSEDWRELMEARVREHQQFERLRALYPPPFESHLPKRPIPQRAMLLRARLRVPSLPQRQRPTARSAST